MKRLHYSKSEESYLKYNEGQLLEYAVEVQSAILPSDLFALLKQTSHFASFVETLLVARMAADDEPEDAFSWLDNEVTAIRPDGEASLIDLGEMLSVAWRWHSDVVARRLPLQGHYASVMFLGWSSFCQLFYLCAQSDETRLAQLRHWPAQDYAFYQKMALQHTIEITNLPISLYSCNDLWCSVRLITTTGLYTQPYTVELKQYFYALFYRYCELISAEQGDISIIMDNPLFVTELPKQESDKLIIPLNDQLALCSEYVYDGQSLFYSQLYRISLSDRLETLYDSGAMILQHQPDEETTRLSQKAWLEMLRTVFKDKLLGQFIVTDFKQNILRLHLYHGETEQYRRLWPDNKADPSEVLSLLRPDDHLAAMAIQALPLMEVAAKYEKEPSVVENEMVYLTKQVTERWLASRNVQGHKTRLAPLFQMEQLTTLELLDEWTLREQGDPPLLLGLMHLYYVVSGPRLFRTENFTYAYLVWLQLLMEQHLVSLNDIPPTLHECIGLFSVI